MPAPQLRQIHVLVKVPPSIENFFVPNKRPRLETVEDIPEIQLSENDYVTLPAALVAKCSLRSDGDLMLYCHPQMRELWQFLRNDVVVNNVKGFVVGPPGTGKSVSTLCFAASLDRREWNVVWIHLSRGWAPHTCLAMSTSVNEFWYVANLSTFELPRVDKRKVFICVDGVVEKETHVAVVQRVLTYLGDEDRLVVCSSMATFGSRNDQDDDRAKIQPFQVYSRRPEDYLAATSDPEFYATVKEKFDATSVSEVNDESDNETLDEEVKKRNALDSNFYYAGGSCRFMFQGTTEDVNMTLERALDCADTTDLVKFCGRTLHPESLNLLYGLQRGGLNGENIPMSSYVASRFAEECGTEVIARLAARLHFSGPSMDNYQFELLFFAAITKCAVKLFDKDGNEDILLQASVLPFDPKKQFKRLDKKKTFYPGVILRCRSSNKYDINYENGWKETNVPVERIQLSDEQKKTV